METTFSVCTVRNICLGLAIAYVGKRLVHYLWHVGHQSRKLPPGPSPLPLVGNLFDLPDSKEYDWIHWAKHKRLYGPISSISVFGKPIVILNDLQVAFDLFDKRSLIYSDRPVLTFGGELCGWEDNLPLIRYGERFRSSRLHIHKFMGTSKLVVQFNDVIREEARRLLFRLEQAPGEYTAHLRSYAGAVILSVSYGYIVNQKGLDPLVELANEALHQFSEAMTPGRWLVDTVPVLKYIPDWFPGAHFKRFAKKTKATIRELEERPYAFVKKQMSEGQARPSYIEDFLSRDITDSDEISIIKHSAASLYAGGSDTTVSIIHSFILAMVLYPEVQKKAQAEIDAIVGAHRLPAFEDRQSLPYVNAIITEALRWNPVLPIDFPHVTSEDDNYEGYFIPKGAPVIANIWQFTHDPAEYHDPMSFKPERFLPGKKSASESKHPERDPREIIFGFGRRICPCRVFADVSIFMSISMILAVFDLKKPLDSDGREVDPEYEYNSGLLSHPNEFKCRIIPRSVQALGLIKSIEEEHPFVEGDAEKLKNLDWKPPTSM